MYVFIYLSQSTFGWNSPATSPVLDMVAAAGLSSITVYTFPEANQGSFTTPTTSSRVGELVWELVHTCMGARMGARMGAGRSTWHGGRWTPGPQSSLGGAEQLSSAAQSVSAPCSHDVPMLPVSINWFPYIHSFIQHTKSLLWYAASPQPSYDPCSHPACSSPTADKLQGVKLARPH